MVSMHKRETLCRLTAALLCLCMMASCAGTALAEGVTPRVAEPTQYIMPGTRVADPDTMDDYLNRLLSQDNGSRYAGRVWTDKTVFAYGATGAQGGVAGNRIQLDMATDGYVGNVGFKSDFAHVFSALASSQVVNEYPPSPVDLVIVFDMSGSMGQDTRYSIDPGYNTYQAHVPDGDSEEWPDGGVPMADRIAHSRVQATLTAINETIDGLMAQNPQNRVAVCGYGANAVVLMPLGHYKKVSEDTPYLSVGGMETLYHPSDLVYRTKNDKLTKNGVELPAVTEDGWYWMNNRDTCYTVVVNAFYNTYTGVLDSDGDGSDTTDKSKPTDSWTKVDKTVSNNVRDSEGNLVKAFPGAWDSDGKPDNTYANRSVEVYINSYTAKSQQLIDAMEKTEGLKADDYVGYFTNTQGGIYLAYKQLADSEATTYSERLSNHVMSTVARIPAAIIMSDGGANFAFNEMGEEDKPYLAEHWYERYGQRCKESVEQFNYDRTEWENNKDKLNEYMNDNLWDAVSSSYSSVTPEGRRKDIKHRLVGAVKEEDVNTNPTDDGDDGNTGDEWYNVFLPGGETLSADWNGLHGMLNTGADYYKDGTLTSQPVWNHAGVLFNSDNTIFGTSGAVLEVLLTASYMNEVVKEHYAQGWVENGATEDSRKHNLSTYTMNVDTEHVPIWGRWRLYPTLNPKEYALDKIDEWYTREEEFGSDKEVYDMMYEKFSYWGDDNAKRIASGATKENLFSKGAPTGTYNSLKHDWENFKGGHTALAAADYNPGGIQTSVLIKPIPAEGSTYSAGGGDTVTVTNDEVLANVAYNDKFYDVTSSDLSEIFDEILTLILGNVFVPVSGDNDAGVGDSITYQDPLGEYMEIKDQSILATPHHVDNHAANEGKEGTYDMALLVFGEMHGLVRTGVYDYKWNDTYMNKHKDEPGAPQPGKDKFPMGWYWGDDPETAVKASRIGNDGTGTYPLQSLDGKKTYSSAADARADGWVYRLDFQTLIYYVPIANPPEDGLPNGLSTQMQNTVYTIYRFAGSTDDRNALHRNPIYGEVPTEIQEAWKKEHDAKGSYPVDDGIYAGTPGVYRLSDIRVWVEDTGDFVDTTGAIAPEAGYDRSLYLNIPAAAVPTELATITLGPTGVVSYKTNLGADHPEGSSETDDKGKTTEVSEDRYKSYCYQSTPLRLFYAVGLEEDLILRNDDGSQRDVNIAGLSEEYIEAHTNPANGDIYFISNYYSNTPFGEYVTDTLDSRTRGDPTITFSPSIDNRYYVFQKPLPLFAHAYRVLEGGVLSPVDKQTPEPWPAAKNQKGGNGATAEGATTPTWETVNGAQQRPGAWVGGLYMGVYEDAAAFRTAYDAAMRAETDDKTITDANDTSYPLVTNGIVFLEEDLLEHVTSTTKDPTGYTEDSIPFSSDDYFFLLVEYYLPDGGVGKDNKGDTVYGTQAAHGVQRVVARKGSEFGSAFQSDAINNGDMLCWTDMNNRLNVEFTYVSRSDTGDNTRGEPTYEKLFYEGAQLENYLEDLGVKKTAIRVPDPTEENPEQTKESTILAEQVNYWTEIRSNPLVERQLAAVREKANEDYGNESEESCRKAFAELFQFAVAARPGGIRTGDMANNRLTKSANTTGTANSYYLPAVSGNSGTDNGVILNNYLGNNGRLEIANAMLLVTKLLEATPGVPLPADSANQEFLYQLYVQGVTGPQTATVIFRNPFANVWQRQVGTVDVITDNHDLLQTTGSVRALFVRQKSDVGTDVYTARQVLAVTDASGKTVYHYANEDGTDSGEEWVGYADADHPEEDLYYLYLPPNDTDSHTRRIYQALVYHGEDEVKSKILDQNRLTIYMASDYPLSDAQREADAAKGINYSTDIDEKNRPAGTFAYWVEDAELIPVTEVEAADAAAIANGTEGDPSGGGDGGDVGDTGSTGDAGWKHEHASAEDRGKHVQLGYYTLVVTKPEYRTSGSEVYSPFLTRSHYITKTITFGQNAQENALAGDGSPASGPLAAGDLYDTIIPKGDRPDLFGNLTNEQIAANTAEFTLTSGSGLLLTGLRNSAVYRYTEKLTDAQKREGYALKEVTHVQQADGQTIYRPGSQQIPVYTGAGALNSDLYPEQFRTQRTENDLTWALDRDGSRNSRASVSYEPYNHSNAVIWEYYATLRGTSEDATLNVVGNHHHPQGVTAEDPSNFYLWSGKPGQYVERTDVVDPIDPNPSCRPLNFANPESGGCDWTLDDGTVRHYIYYKGVLVDPHYEGEASAFLRNMARFVVSATAHFAVQGEQQGQAEKAPPAQANTEYTGVYSTFGNTGYFEEQSHYVNTVVEDSLAVAKTVRESENARMTDKDLETEFVFTLNLYAYGAGLDAGGNPTGAPLTGPCAYIVTEDDDSTGKEKIVRFGCLRGQNGALVTDYTAPEGAKGTPAHVDYSADIGGWRFSLRNGQTLTVSSLPAEYAYTVTETDSGLFTPTQRSVSKAVRNRGAGLVALSHETFVNEKLPPEPAKVTLTLTKTLVDPCGKYDWRNKPFAFTVTPSPANPLDDPIRSLPGWDEASGALLLRTGGNAFASGERAVLTAFDGLPYASENTYVYTISEQIAAQEQDMRYDRSVYTVTVAVARKPGEPEPGKLEATVTRVKLGEEQAEVAFENHCDRKPDLPLTGDDSAAALWLALAALSGVLICALAAAKARAGKGTSR